MRKHTRLLIFVVVLVAVAVLLTGCPPRGEEPSPQQKQEAKQEAEKPGEEKSPEPNAAQMMEDQAPNGCVSCHRKKDDKDYRLSAEVKNIEGHPQVKEDATLKDCIQCHGHESERPFRTILHRIHLVEGEHYLEKYDKNCINCHRVSEEGEVTVKGLEEQ
ncbi:hypothetical protein [Calderihabitans maritimus]|uniref:Uncharacterized protein n=1 Tax=Calderihabitans maritimus TaxID=1246530 RepID=A0A1Z5HNR6_9FIRM|nr:hypothetical protein [Calderihabitans maritimus]GAW91154.1 hypothetical protein KKC1_03160 [Calderihabitans maritimus]